ncbi:hypothetical protein BCR42DRAFT_210221 [Absidia repens]|uniref:SNRNP25 ubiquitin-like domain-containing protein n=1 Tax=Absidia repens TaxID=90262 RepID=A0A1X2IQM1_9FUNG|nr:hypothetical protein BCR42DRAFT_210221 [Absidia repens]
MTEEKQQVDKLEETISSLLKDPILSDITARLPTEKDLDILISLEQGHAYRIQVKRGPLPPIHLIVGQSSTVRDIKKLFEHEWTLQEKNKQRSVSWKYIWRTYCLQFKHQRLLNDDAVVSQIGIQLDSILTFARLSHDKHKHRKAWRWSKTH